IVDRVLRLGSRYPGIKRIRVEFNESLSRVLARGNCASSRVTIYKHSLIRNPRSHSAQSIIYVGSPSNVRNSSSRRNHQPKSCISPVLYRYIRPLLTKVKLEWVNFQVMRRTHSSLMRELRVDPKIVADLMGHDVNVNLNVYTQTMESRLQAVETLEMAF